MIVAFLPDLGDVELWYSGGSGCGWVARCRAGACGQVCGQVHDGAAGVAGVAGVAGGPAGEGEQPVAQPFRLPPAGLVPCEGEHLGPGGQAGGERDDDAPDLVLSEVVQRQEGSQFGQECWATCSAGMPRTAARAR